MRSYPETFFEAIRRLRFARRIAATPENTAMNLECGCIVVAEAEVDESGQITGCDYRTNGCPFMIAAAEAACKAIAGSKLADFGGEPAVAIAAAIDSAIGRPPIGRANCGVAATEAFLKAFASLREKRLRESQSEMLLVCSCFGIAEGAIAAYARSNPDATLSDVIRDCRAGSGCGSCRPTILEILDAISAEAAQL